ncbi:MAG TPA: efflux RND transporter periplasmic adaptor subunit [Steroidobacteraceae bacterium]|jgi:multidrug efflux system membrane fusion protein|nr:efflux RND transporter periplasmic adaptor subunit [Steroidobacteraceae bacterium]
MYLRITQSFSATICALALAGCGHSRAQSASNAAPPPATPPPATVTVAEVIARPLHHWDELTGELQAVNSVEVHPRVSGFIDSVEFVEGARVVKGQLLFQIDPRPYQIEMERLSAEIKRAQSKLDFATAGHARAERLFAQNAIAREEYEQLTSAETEAAGDLGSLNAQLHAARLNLEYTHVRSPIEGHVSRALITSGNLVSNVNLLTTVVSDDPIYAYFDTDEATYLKFTQLQQGGTASGKTSGRSASSSPVYIGLVGENGYPHQGRLDFIDNQVDSRSSTIHARAVFDNKDGHFTPGLFARIKLVANDSYDAILIDERAVGNDLGKKFVLVLKPDNTLEYRPVALGTRVDGLRVVEDGLHPSETIVVNGLQHVTAGAVVRATRVAMTADGSGLAQVAAVAPSGKRLLVRSETAPAAGAAHP